MGRIAFGHAFHMNVGSHISAAYIKDDIGACNPKHIDRQMTSRIRWTMGCRVFLIIQNQKEKKRNFNINFATKIIHLKFNSLFIIIILMFC